MKRTKLKKNSAKESAKLQRKLWPLCRQLVRQMYGNRCYTCNAEGLAGKNWHTGHMLNKRICGAYLKYDIRILRPQCYNCNINLGGNGSNFLRNMIIREGQEYVDQIFRDKNLIVKGLDRYQYLYEKYSLMIEDKVLSENGK